MDGANVYGYCKGDPVNLVDPYGYQAMGSGLMPWVSKNLTGDFVQMQDSIPLESRQIRQDIDDNAPILHVELSLGQGSTTYAMGKTAQNTPKTEPDTRKNDGGDSWWKGIKKWWKENVFRGWEYGKWKKRGKWQEGKHFHLGPGKNLMKHHLPQELSNWGKHAKNLITNIFR